MGPVLYGGSSCPQKMGWRVAVFALLLCGSSQSRPSLLGAAPGGDHHHHHEARHEPHQSVDYSYSDYDYQPEEGRSLGAEDEYYEDAAPARAYNFQFQGEEQSRQEEQNEDGLVTGSYSYLGADGVQHTVNYRAGAGIGFEIIDPSVDHMFADFGAKVDEPLPVAAVRDAAPAVVVEAPAVAPDALYGAPAAVAPDTLYGAPAEELPSYAEELPSYVELPRDESSSEEVEATTTGMMMDPSYYFQYKSADSERTEDADSTGAVVGSYSYLSPGGQEIVVRYRAGADTGFVIENQDELNSALLRAASEPFEAKEEVVVEQASEPREHVYTLEGDDEDVLPTPLSGSPPPLESLYSAPPPAAAEPTSLYGAPALEPLPSYEEAEAVAAPAMMMMDPSYNFAYAGDAGNREEAADSQGVVTGSYSYLSPEGNEILVRYTAGADTGFVIENSDELAASVREATDAGAEAAAARAVAAAPLPIGSSAAASDSVVISVPDSLYGAPAPAPAESLPSYQEEIPAPVELLPSYQEEPAAAPQMVMDASFNFAVDEEEHKFEEEADRTGERTGSYSYQAPDGTLVKVRYTAGRDGFVILNPEEVLPQAPQV